MSDPLADMVAQGLRTGGTIVYLYPATGSPRYAQGILTFEQSPEAIGDQEFPVQQVALNLPVSDADGMNVGSTLVAAETRYKVVAVLHSNPFLITYRLAETE